MVEVKFKKLCQDAQVPKYSHEDDACFDLVSSVHVRMKPGKVVLVNTGLCVEIPIGYEMQIRPRSSIAMHGIIIPNSPCTVDAGYRGEIKIPMLSLNGIEYTIHIGDRFAQAMVSPILKAYFVEVSELSSSSRGKGGFGSTGK